MSDNIDVSQMSRAQKQAMLKELLERKKQKASYYPLSSGQKGLWFLQKMHPESYAYNVPCAFSLNGTIDAEALNRAINALADHRTILRTVLKTDASGEPLQSVAYKTPVDVRVRSISQMAESEIEPFLRQIAREPFDLEEGPLFRAYLLTRSKTQAILLFNFHHIIFDGSSLPLFVNDLTDMYRSALAGEKAEATPSGASFGDYVHWQRDMLAGEEGNTHKTYWLDRLAGDLPVLNLPEDIKPGSGDGAGGCDTYRMEISVELSQSLRRVAEDHRVYLFTVLLGAFQVLLHRYTEQDDIITGIPMAGRNRTEFEDLIGYFINMVPIRADLSGDITFAELMQQLHKAGMEALTHQEYPFPEMVKSLRETGWGGSSDTFLFQTSFVLQNWAKNFDKNLIHARDDSPGFTLEPMLSIQQEEDFNLALEALDLEAFQFFFKYDAGLYRRDTIARMAGHFNSLLRGIAENPGRKISQLPLFAASDRREILEGWNDTGTKFPDGTCLHQLIETQAEKTPGATAIIFGEEELSYAALNQRANQIGRYLGKAGVGPGTRVAVCMERSVNMVVGILGILKAGGAYVPVDPAYPEDRIRYMLDDSAAPLIVTEIQRLDALPEHDAKVICLDAEASAIGNEDGEDFSCGVTAADLAYVIYTSGSTGKPKGVMIRHRGLPNLAQAQIRMFGVEPSSRVLQFASMSFDASISEIAMALCSGAALCLASKSDLMPGKALEDTLVRHAVTHVTLPPTALAVMQPERLTGLSTIVVAGEACPPELAALWSKNMTFINAYGPTEGTVCASGLRYEGGQGDRLPIGRPIANTRLYILGRHLQPVPVGVPGELHIAGVGLAKGYLNRPDLTEEKFIPNPFASEGQEDYRRIYKTGDLCRYLPDGNIEFLGRMDHQVKIRGFRIEPGEIEAVLRAHAQVRDAVVDIRTSGNGEPQLVAYVTPDTVPGEVENLPTQSDLRAHLKTALPDFMIPAPFVWLKAMPLTPNGKIDRKALPAPDPSMIREQAFVAPETKSQKILAGIFSDVLKIENVSIHDDFFMMGGHSLLATVVISRIQKAFKTDLPITGIFNHPTIAGLSRYLEDLKQNRSAAYNAIPAVDRGEPLELSFGQQRLWFLDKFEGGGFASYNVPIAFRVAGKIDVPAVNRAVNEIIRRHEVLRTVFRDPLNGPVNGRINDLDGEAAAEEASAPLQIILPEFKVGLTLMDIAELPEEDRETEAAGIVSKESLTPFDLAEGPLIRVTLVRMTDEEQLLMVTLHHIVFDGWSVGVFFKEFARLYGAYALNKPSPLAEPDIQYADFAAWQRRTLSKDVFARQLKYWENRLAGVPLSTELPTDRPRPPVQTFNGGYVPFTIDTELTGRLNTLSRKSGVTLFMTLYAAFATLLSRYSGKTDIVIGSPVAGRTHVQTEELIGFFVNTLALRADLSEDPKFSDFLVRVKENVLSAYENQDLPFERLIMSEVLNVERSMSQSPLFQVMFDLYNVSDGTASASGGRFETSGLRFSPYDIDYEVAKFDLTLSMIAEADKITARFQYNSDLFDRTTIERSVGHFMELLAEITETPDKPLSRLSILPREEKQRLLTEFNHTTADFPDDILIHERFEANARKTPDALAVVFQDEVLTYRELNQRANRTGHYLQKLGVGPDVLVGLYMERSFEMITGVLGILKAGGAYVPLDPSYPADRIAYIMEDTKAPIILTQDRLLASLPDTQARPVCMDTDWENIEAEDSHNVVNEATPDHMCYVIYTSGTTGRPKGVMIEHRSVCARLSFWQGIYGLNTEDVAVHYRPYSFDGSTEEYLLPLWVGAKFIMAPSNIAVTDNIADYLITTIETYGITKINMPPVLLDVFLTVLKKSGMEKVKSLHTVVSGGDKLTADIARKFEALFDSAYLYNTYGPTENSIDSLNWRCDMAAGNGRVLLGKSIANTKSFIVDGNGALVPLGVPGELMVSGIGLARGYLNRPNLTKEVFIPNPFSDKPGSRIYKTGDLCRCLPDGNIEFLGRIDHQVKIRGFRIELGEIESVLSRHELVNETVVLAREDRPGNKQLAAYVVPIDPDQRPEEADVRAFLRTILPDYMIPAFIVFMDELPLTPNGKIDRKGLPVPVLSNSGNAYAAPRTRNEKILAQIWAKTLGVPRVGINDNFFALGGDSIISIRIISRASDKGLSFTVKQIFEHQTLGELARAAGVRKLLAAEQGVITGAVPLTPMMERFFSAPCIDPNHFNQYLVVRISHTWEADMLDGVFSAMLTQHDALRLQFVRDDENWTASCADVVPDSGDGLLTVTDLPGLSPDDQMAAMADMIRTHQKGFDLSAGSLLKAVLFRTGESTNYLWVIIHHLAVDGVSWRIFMEDFERLCTKAANGEAPVLRPKTTSLKTWASRLKEYAGSNALTAETDYWLKQTDAAPLPQDYPPDPSVNTTKTAKTLTLTLSEADTHILLHKAPDVYGSRADVLLLAALLKAICKWTGQPQALIGLEGHGREDLGDGLNENQFGDMELSKTMGWFTSFFPVLLKTKDEQGLPETVAAVQAQVDAIPNRGIGYGVLRYMACDPDIREKLAALPSPQVIFNYFGQVDETFVGGEVAFERLGFSESPRRTRQNMIDIGGGVINGRLQMAVSYCSKIHKEDTIRRVTDDFSTTLHKLIHGAHGRKQSFIHKALPQFPELVYLNKGTTGAPVFWIHGGLGGVGAYVKLARRIQRPFYGIQARGWMTDRAPLEGVRRKAAYYLRIIRTVQPEGPYHLGGYSYGGKVAYEMTRQLQAIGESVASIVMLDSRLSPQTAPPATPEAFNMKEAMLQAVNAVLIESTFARPDRMDDIMIHRSELDTRMADEQFMAAISEHPKTLAVFKTGEKAAAQIRGIAEAIEKSREENFVVRPLPEPDAVTCRFFRDKSGDMFGNLAPYFSFEDRDRTSGGQTSKNQAGNCDLWKANISDFRLMDVDSPNHMAMLTDPTSFEEIARGCEVLYGENRIPETVLN